MKRTHLPLNALRVYDAAARHLSFTRAADELAVTPAAVGQQIRALEDVLGVVLFRRLPGGLELTPEGEAGLDALRDGFLQFEESVRAMRGGQGSDVLTIAAPRDVTSRWLLPRLTHYQQRRPEVRIRVESADITPDFTEANLDLAVAFGPVATGFESVPLHPTGSVWVARGDAPDRTIVAAGSADDTAAFRLADHGLALDAVRLGAGTALLPRMLVQDDLQSGVLRTVRDGPAEIGYHLVAPLPQWRQHKVKSLVEMLAS